MVPALGFSHLTALSNQHKCVLSQVGRVDYLAVAVLCAGNIKGHLRMGTDL